MSKTVWVVPMATLFAFLISLPLPSWGSSSSMETNPDPTSLARLHDIVMGPSIGWWPLAAGWYILIGLLILMIGWVSVGIYRRYAQNQYRRQALAELKRLQPLSRQFGGQSVAASQIMELLKRTAFVNHPREHIASLNGSAWWRFLDEEIGGHSFVQSVGPTLERLTYGNPFASEAPREEVDAVFRRVTIWVKTHPSYRRKTS